VAQRGRALQRAVEFLHARSFGIGGDRDFDLADDGLDFGAGFPQRLARLARNQFGKGFGVLAHRVGKAPDQLDPLRQRHARPVAHRVAPTRDRRFYVSGLAAPDLGPGRRFGRN
jgi:hypothetical protein